jgi:CIC family chloride channel protein
MSIIDPLTRIPKFIQRFGLWLDRIQPSGAFVVGVSAILVGLLSAGVVMLFKWLIEQVHWVMFDIIGDYLAQWGGWTVALLPLIGGLVVAQISLRYMGHERHHGVAGIIESVALAGGRLRYWRIPAKLVGAAVSIGSGASVGPEDPSVQAGSNIGSMMGQWFRFSDSRTRTLVGAGAAAGIAAAFNAPIAGVFFALELIFNGVITSSLGAILLAAVASAVFTQAIEGAQPAFRVPQYSFHTPLELPLYLILGALAGPISALYIRLIYRMQDWYHGASIPPGLKTATAGLAVGLVGIFLPQVMGDGYGTIETILNGNQFTLGILLLLLLAKLILTPVSVSGGFLGGVFAPSLFLGAMLGSALGRLADIVLPELVVAPAAYAMVGMAAVLAGVVHAPLTAIMLLFEMTNDYRIILPLMFAVSVSTLTSQLLQRESVYMLGLARKGIRIKQGRDVEVMEGLRVSEVMHPEFATLHETDPLSHGIEVLMTTHSHGLVVVDDHDELIGILALQDIERAQLETTGQSLTIGQVCTRDNLLVAYPDESLGHALRRMSVRDIGRMPVVSRNNPRHLVGVIRRSAVIRAYDVALVRRAANQQTVQQVQLTAADENVNIHQIKIKPKSPYIGQQISAVPWPRDCVIATLRRGRRVIIPHGDTVLYAGDVLVVVADGDVLNQVLRLCNPPE